MDVRRVSLGVLIAATAMLLRTAPSHAALDYRDWAEGTSVLIAQSILYGQAKLYTLGEVSDPTVFQVGMLISEDADVEDGGQKNALMIECGMHAREWYATEACYWVIDHLLRRRNSREVQELLRHVDVWVIPQSNPAGRNIDDLRGGDPARFARFCNSGIAKGNPCTSHSECPGSSCNAKGWRNNANLSPSPLGVNLARNFSSGWDDADPNHTLDYRGPTPFSELEALNLRRFVNNHMISMALVVHANSQEISHRWAGPPDPNKPPVVHRASDFMAWELVDLNHAGSSSYLSRYEDPRMRRTGVGGGHGQFSGWLAGRSNVMGELDEDTERNISTFFFELPIWDERYGRPYQATEGDGSNSFHPSGGRMESLWRSAIRDLFLYLIRQARSPQCPVDAFATRIVAECENDDFGLVGAKLADDVGLPGMLDYDPVSREETLPSGTRQVVFAAQNFGKTGSTSTNATITVRESGIIVATHVEPVSLADGERAVYAWPYNFAPNSTYQVTIALDADGFGRNNHKIFAFRSGPAVFRPIASFARVRVRLQERRTEDRATYRGVFDTARPLTPDFGGLEVTLRGSAPYSKGGGPLQPLHYLVPGGPPWWDKSKPTKGVWQYRDPDHQNGPVEQVKIRQKISKKTGKAKTKISIRVSDAALGALADARAHRADVYSLYDDITFTLVGASRIPKLPAFTTPPGDETEKEP